MHLDCPDCNTQIPAEGVNIAKTIAVCKHCNNIFDFKEEFPTTAELPAVYEPPRRLKEEIYHIPPGIEVLKIESMLEIMINWRRSGKYFTFFFGIMWNAFLLSFVVMAFAGGVGSAGFFLVIFLLPFIGVGAYLLYSGLAQIINTTFVTVNNRYVSIEHKPINFLMQKDQYYNREEVDQLYVKRYSVGSTNGEPVYAFSVYLILKNGKKIALVKNLHSVETARFIEQEVENYLNIEDQVVNGEWSSDILKKNSRR